MNNRWPGLLLCTVVALVVGVIVGSSGFIPVWMPTAPAGVAAHGLDALLWFQTSGEYEACCLQAFRLGTDRLDAKLSLAANGDARPPAVVMDLDETVLDNSPFQAYLDRHSLVWTEELWTLWERDHPDDVRLVPGAKAFIDLAESKKVTVVYITNRLEEFRDSTIKALKHVGLNTNDIDGRLMLRDGFQGPGDKSARRAAADKRYRVLLYFGDNLRDFSEEFVAPKVDPNNHEALMKAIAKRREEVVREAAHFGDDWIILPNPIYGEWQKLVGRKPLKQLEGVDLKPVGK